VRWGLGVHRAPHSFAGSELSELSLTSSSLHGSLSEEGEDEEERAVAADAEEEEQAAEVEEAADGVGDDGSSAEAAAVRGLPLLGCVPSRAGYY
jgi:hypothetical protein